MGTKRCGCSIFGCVEGCSGVFNLDDNAKVHSVVRALRRESSEFYPWAMMNSAQWGATSTLGPGLRFATKLHRGRSVIIGASEPRVRKPYLRPQVKPFVRPAEEIVPGIGHAEMDILKHADANGLKGGAGGAGGHEPRPGPGLRFAPSGLRNCRHGPGQSRRAELSPRYGHILSPLVPSIRPKRLLRFRWFVWNGDFHVARVARGFLPLALF